MIGYWHHPVVCLSVALCIVALRVGVRSSATDPAVELTTLSQIPYSRLGEGTPPSHTFPPQALASRSRRLRRLACQAPQHKFLATPMTLDELISLSECTEVIKIYVRDSIHS